MKKFVSLDVDHEDPNESSVVVFLAESKEDAVFEIIKDRLDDYEIEMLEKAELDEIDVWIYDEYPIMIGELKGELDNYHNTPAVEFESYYTADITTLLTKKTHK